MTQTPCGLWLAAVPVWMALVGVPDSGTAEPLAALGWLEGDWRGPMKRGHWEARYTGPEGGRILSTNKHVDGAELLTFEYEQFLVQNGAIVMQPYPDGEKSPIHFTMTELDPAARRAVFENPEHDFPQRLVYHRTAEERLHIQVLARRDGEWRGFELDLTRAD